MEKEDIISLQIDKNGFLEEIQKIANPTDFLKFLDLCANNVTMSFRNQVALYRQAKDICNACGIKARSRATPVKTENLQSAVVLYYNLKTEDSELKPEYIPIEVVGDTSEPNKEGFLSFESDDAKNATIPDLVAKTGLIIELIPKANLKHPIAKSDYDIEKGVIQVVKGLNNRQYAEVLIAAFTRFCLESKSYTDKILQASVIYVVSKYFNINANKGIQGVLFNQAFQYDSIEFLQLLEDISVMSFSVIEALTGQLLSFDETSVINTYLDEDNVEDFASYLIEMQQETDDEETIKILSELAEKIDDSTLESVGYLLAQKEEKGIIYTYPPFRFERNQNILD